jgi:hypothetical protein
MLRHRLMSLALCTIGLVLISAQDGRAWPRLRHCGRVCPCQGKAIDEQRSQPSPTPPSEIQSLNDRANDLSLSQDDRAKAIFALFANHIKVGNGPLEVHRVLIRTDWMKFAIIDVLGGLGGWIPLDVNKDDDIYWVRLFPDKEGWSKWVIYFRLSGLPVRYGEPEESAEDGRKFLRGSTDLQGNPKLMEFALCGPDNGSRRFTAKGVIKYVLNVESEDNDESSPTMDERQSPAAPDQLR